jgi:prepilin-type N-terminal cleavage/methylation domain-containing protein
MSLKGRQQRAFTMLELVIVVVIIGIIAAIAIPRLSRGTAGAADSALSGDLAVLRNAIDLFSAEHTGTYPQLATFANQLMLYSDATGATAAAKDATHIYGPYIRSVPTLPVGTNKGSATVTDTLGTAGFGWVYDQTKGTITANCANTEVDAAGKQWNQY